jgi:hypothetical protein
MNDPPIVKPWKPGIDPRELYIAAMFLMYMRAPGQRTAPGEIVDLGEIGEVREKNWSRLTPYFLVRHNEDDKDEE